MGEGGRRSAIQELTWSEVQKHVSRDDRWIVVDGEVYDVTHWSRKHPGGSRLIGHYAGQDATEAFSAFHNELDQVRKYLKPLHVGTLKNHEDNEMNKDFRMLKQAAIKMGLFEPSFTFYTLILAHIVLLLVGSYVVLYMYGNVWWAVLLSLAMFSVAQVQAAWTQHDFGHLSVFKTSTLDHFMHHLVMGLMKGASASWWNHMHYQHHAKPNVIDKDPDVRIDQLFVVGEVMPVRVAQERKKSMPFNLQHKYFFALGPPLLFPVYFQYMLFRHEVTRKLWMELFITLCFVFGFYYLTIPILGLSTSIAFYFSFR
ncbi:acyl-CoA 6-desaturase-like [Dreissena polymorpha]|uniref:acyl-CoA 6-desaturase-like n=1 Tax=Dreissena polymorpha TaxID=45954 RepID=UPI002263EE4C|nr:acyl-CoA 6-desaturase-like [Dreissena polymorpha]